MVLPGHNRMQPASILLPMEAERISRPGPGADPPDVVVAVFVPDHAERLVPTVRSLARLGYPVVLGSDRFERLGPLPTLAAACVETWSAANLVNDVWNEWHTNVLAVTDAVLLPDEFLAPALEIIEADTRVATVSFFANDASYLSFPHRNHPVEKPEPGHDATSVTRLLRQMAPPAPAVPIPMAAGAAVLLSSAALATLRFLRDAPSGAFSAAVADFSCRGRQKGLFDVLDPSTYCARFGDLSVAPRRQALALTGLTLDDNGWLHDRHPMVNSLVADEQNRHDSSFALAFRTAQAKLLGLRVLVDGSCLGPQEMGTQVATTALIGALALDPEVREVCVALPGPVPPYASAVFSHSKIRAEGLPADGDLGRFGRCDIAHRPFQPNADFDVARWRAAADRVVITIHDLISFHIGTYSGEVDSWLRYRDLMRQAARHVDGTVVISEDVRRQLAFESLETDARRTFVVPNGTEHLTGGEAARLPDELVRRGLSTAEFILCLGTDYSHKNRELAIGAYVELRRRGWLGTLLLVGPSVPWGSSRADEAAVLVEQKLDDNDVVTLPDLPFEERNWLLRHAALVLYPTSAEGFGLIPFEAARFGTPTVYVGFGPLAEFSGRQPVLAEDWSPPALADAAERLLGDPALAARQIEETVLAGTEYTWARSARGLVAAYRSVLSMPGR